MNPNRLTNETTKAMDKAYEMAVQMGFSAIEPPLLAIVLLVNNRHMAEAVLLEKNLSVAQFMDTLAEALSTIPRRTNPQSSRENQPDISDSLNRLLIACAEESRQVTPEKIFRALVREYYPETPRHTRRERQGNRSALALYARDLKQLAAENKLSPVIGREEEIEQVIKTLLRKTKSNPVLVGDPGTGKTAIAEGVAMRIESGDVPPQAASFHLYAVDLASMVAGASAYGQFEQRLKDLMAAATADPEAVLFIDELHQLIGTGGNHAMDAANILKPALARGEIKVIGATTYDEYREYVESDKAFERRFQKVRVEELSPEQTLEVLRGIKPSFEAFHCLAIEEAALEEAVDLSQRYMTARHLPDKAIDVLDEAASNVRYRQGHTVGVEEIRAVIGKLTGVPAEKLDQNQSHALLELEDRLGTHVFGQDEAIRAVSAVIRRNKVNISDTTRPIGSFLCVGPTGVGKTELAKTLAEEVMGSIDKVIRIDMSEYQQPHNVSRLFGAPPGYVGYGRGGQLTEAVRQQPYSVILLDEIEKAHPRVFETLLQVLDDGRMTDGEGRTVDFRNTIILMTSNLGSREAAQRQRRTPVGFNAPSAPVTTADDSIEQAVKACFAPEFLNRLDGVIHFNALDRNLLLRIARKQLDELSQRLSDGGHTVRFEEEVAGYIVDTDADPAYGARPIRRAIERCLIEPITRMILEKGGEEPLTLHVSTHEGRLSFESL